MALSPKKQALLKNNGYTFDEKRSSYVGPNGKVINKAAVQGFTSTWLENAIKQQQGSCKRG